MMNVTENELKTYIIFSKLVKVKQNELETCGGFGGVVNVTENELKTYIIFAEVIKASDVAFRTQLSNLSAAMTIAVRCSIIPANRRSSDVNFPVIDVLCVAGDPLMLESSKVQGLWRL